MERFPLIMEVLHKYSAPPKTPGTAKPLNQKEILDKLREEYPHLAEDFSEKKLRASLEKMVRYEATLPEEKRLLRYVYGGQSHPDAEEEKPHPKARIRGYWINRLFRDEELKFLIDQVMYGSILQGGTAQNLARRLQSLGGEHLRRQTPYASGGFGPGRRTVYSDVSVLDNLAVVMDAIAEQKQISFTLNVYQVKAKQIVLWPVPSPRDDSQERVLTPIDLIFADGRYYMLGVYEEGGKVYYHRLDLMKKVKKLEKSHGVDPSSIPERANVSRGGYRLMHPVLYGGEVRTFTLRVRKEHLTQVVDAFGDSLRPLPNTETDQTIDVSVEATTGSMERWLVRFGDILTAVDLDQDFAENLRRRVNTLWEKYGG